MDFLKKIFLVIVTISIVTSLSLTLTGCPPQPPAEEAEEATPTEEETTPEKKERVTIRWYIGLGTGSSEEQMPDQEALVEEFNTSQDEIELVVEFIVNEQAPDVLKTQIAGGNPPDIVGPVGQSGVNEFEGLFLDLSPYLEDYDWSDFDQGSIDAYRLAEGTFGIPFAVFPSVIYYNRDLFDEAGLDYPPHEWDEDYADGEQWNIEKLEELAMLLTVDANGYDATSPDFDPENIEQFGYFTQWTLPRGEATALFGADNVVDENGNAMLSDRWRQAFHWYYEGMHKKHFIPNATYQESDLLAAGNPFDSGNVAMVHCHLWYTCCCTNVPNWDAAAVPSHGDGELISKLHADTFRILKSTENPEEAVEVLKWIVGDAAAELLPIYGGFPARMSLQEAFLATLDEKFTQGVDWKVFTDALAYPDIPNHECNLPNYSKAFDRLEAFQSLYYSEPNLDFDAELDKLVSDLQAIFEEEE